jgi:ubiquinone/menaquinone biosynthesis C-methylase UbiE
MDGPEGPRRIEYDEALASRYHDGRVLPAAAAQRWMEALRHHLSRKASLRILDLGSGTGRFAPLLADAFDADVLGVEPAPAMRAQAARHGRHPRVRYADGSAAAIPAGDGELDAAFLSMVIHHVPDIPACARELRRVLSPDGVVFIRSVFGGRLDGIPYFEFFPTARQLDEARMPTVDTVRTAFEGEAFAFVALDVSEQEIDASLADYHARMTQRALSTFKLLTQREIDEGLAQMKAAAERQVPPAPVVERIDLLVLRRR